MWSLLVKGYVSDLVLQLEEDQAHDEAGKRLKGLPPTGLCPAVFIDF